MSGGNTKLIYDKCQTLQKTNESVKPGDYRLFKMAHVNCEHECKPDRSTPSNAFNVVDVESELKNITRIESKCNIARFPNNITSGANINSASPRLPAYMPPWACEREIVPTNLRPFKSSMLNMPSDSCPQPVSAGSSYYSKF
jgi:hypothetical protein